MNESHLCLKERIIKRYMVKQIGEWWDHGITQISGNGVRVRVRVSIIIDRSSSMIGGN